MPPTEALLVVPVTPAAAGNGLAMRAGMLLEGLARRHLVRVLVVPVFEAAPLTPLVVDCAASCDAVPLERDPVAAMIARVTDPAFRAAAESLHPLPGPAAMLTPAVAEAVATAAASAELILVMRLYLSPALEHVLAAAGRPPIVLDLDDLDWVRERGLGNGCEAEAYERLAAYILPRVERTLVTSEADAVQVAGRWPRVARPAVVPNGVRRVVGTRGRAPAHDLLFVGTLSYAPNAAAARWTCEEVLPRMPGVSAAIVGRAPPAEVRTLGSRRGVTVAADVADVAPWYAGARVAVVPLHAGAGTRTKILEAWAHEVPVVTTSLGIHGLDPGAAALVADTPRDFAAACRRLLDDPELEAELVAAGRERLSRSGTVAHAIALLDEALTTVAA